MGVGGGEVGLGDWGNLFIFAEVTLTMVLLWVFKVCKVHKVYKVIKL